MEHPRAVKYVCSGFAWHAPVGTHARYRTKEARVRLVQFQVKDFRSVADSGWMGVDDVTALIGVNESGKTNLLLPLWKLNPAREGQIEPTSDYPKPKFGEIRADPGAYWFIEAEFVLGPVAAKVAGLSGLPLHDGSLVRVRRFYDGHYDLYFPEHAVITTIPAADLGTILGKSRALIDAVMPLKDEGDVYNAVLAEIDVLMRELNDATPQDAAALADMRTRIMASLPTEPDEKSKLVPLARDLAAAWPRRRAGRRGRRPAEIRLLFQLRQSRQRDLSAPCRGKPETRGSGHQGSREGPHPAGSVRVRAVERAGNPRSGQRHDQPRGSRACARRDQARPAQDPAARLVFKRSGLDQARRKGSGPDRGCQAHPVHPAAIGGHGPDPQLQGLVAAGRLPNFFRIWVSDSRRPAEVELENRSTGLQWFLSFYLVFLVESKGAHRDAVLLLDEPGVSLHPLAQRDLSAFFEQLGTTNQIIYTSHSPFLVEADRLDRARKVYVSADGTTKVSARLGGAEGTDTQRGAAYAVQSALNLSVAEGLLPEAQPVLVEGRSDQHYLAAIKTLLLSAGRITPAREIVFAPTGGTRTAHIIANILTGRDDDLPLVVLDGDAAGQAMAQALRAGIYAAHPDRVLDLADMIGMAEAGMEDLFPPRFLAEETDRIERTAETRLFDIVKTDAPFVAQVTAWAAEQGLKLSPQWRVDLALRAKRRALQLGMAGFDDAVVARWTRLFDRFGA